MQDKIIHKDLSYQIVGILINVYNKLGPGLREIQYQRALKREFSRHGLSFIEQVKLDLDYYGISLGTYRLDFLIENKIVLEIKSKAFFSVTDVRQVIAYLKKSHIDLGILAGFGGRSLKFKRILRGYK